MHRMLLLGIVVSLAGCKSREGSYRYHFNPPDSSRYRYSTSCDVTLSLVSGNHIIAQHKQLAFATNYLVTKDGNDFVLDLHFDSLGYREWSNQGAKDGDSISVPATIRDLLASLGSAHISARIRPATKFISISGVREMTSDMVNRYYKPEHREAAETYWGQWVEREIVWRNLEPMIWGLPDSGRRVGDRWDDSLTNRDYFNFTVEYDLQLKAANDNVAAVRSMGFVMHRGVDTDFMGYKIKANLMGTESGLCQVGIKTGMPAKVADTIDASGEVPINGQVGLFSFEKRTSIVGESLDK